MNKPARLVGIAWLRLLARINRVRNRQLPQATLFWVFAITIPIVTIMATHVWLRTAYSGGLFHYDGFLEQYDHGIYRYRILGRELILSIYRVLLRMFHDQPMVMPRDPQASTLFYASYVILDGLCFFATNLLLLLILSDRKRRIPDLHLSFYLYLTLIQALAMYVVSPYDQLAYFLIMVSFYAVTISRRWVAYLLLTIAAIAGTLSRETQLLVSSALFSIAIFSSDKHSRRYWISGCCNFLIFVTVYLSLRVCMPGPNIVSGEMTYGGKWALESAVFLVLIFFVNTSLALRIRHDIRPTLVLLICCFPYLITILLSGALRELRLLVPILIAQIFVYIQLEPRPSHWIQGSHIAAIELSNSLLSGEGHQ